MVFKTIGRGIGHLSRNIQRTAGLGWQGIGRGFDNMVGAIAGNYSFTRLRATMNSYYAREVFARKLSGKQFRQLNRAAKKIKYFNTDKYRELYKRYEHHPTILRKKINNFVGLYVRDLNAFVDSFTIILKSIKQAIDDPQKMDFFFLSNIVDILTKVKTHAEAGKLVIPSDSLEHIREKLLVLGQKQAAIYEEMLQTEEYSEDIVRRGKKVRTRITTTLFIDWLGFDLKRLVDLNTRSEVRKFEKVRKEIDLQLETGIRVDFFARLSVLLNNLDKLSIIGRKIRRDFLSLMVVLDEYFNEISKSFAQFILFFQNEPKVKGVTAKMEELDEIRTKLMEALKDEEGRTMEVRKFLDTFEKAVNDIFARIETISQTKMKLVEEGDAAQILRETPQS